MPTLGGGLAVHIRRYLRFSAVAHTLEQGRLLSGVIITMKGMDLDTWIIPGQILRGKPPPGAGCSCFQEWERNNQI